MESALRVLEGRRAFEADACEGLVAHLSAERPGVLFAPALLDAAVEKVNKGGGLAMSGQEGALWWMDRQFEDAKKYMSKKQIAKMEAQRARRTASAASARALATDASAVARAFFTVSSASRSRRRVRPEPRRAPS